MTGGYGAVATALGCFVLLAGCLAGHPVVGPAASPTSSPPATLSGLESGADQPDPHKVVHVRNDGNRSAELHVRVVSETNETVHDEGYELAPETELRAYDIADAEPDGIVSYTVVATYRNTTESVTIETNACYGDVHAEVTADGQLTVYYAIC